MFNFNECYLGDCRDLMRGMIDSGVRAQTCVTSPPYWGLRDYGVDGQLGLESSPERYVDHMIEVFHLVRQLLTDSGTLWLNLGDSYYNYRPGGHERKQSIAKTDQDTPLSPAKRSIKIDGLKEKDLCGIPWRVALALQSDGWYLRQEIIWHKPNPMPESVGDRPTRCHEQVFLLSKNKNYFYDAEAISEPAIYAGDQRGERGDARRGTECNAINGNTGERRNKRSVWQVATVPYEGAHFATFPPKLVEPCVMAGTSSHGACPHCAAPHERVVEREFVPQADIRDPEKLAKAGNKGLDESNGWGDAPRGTTRVKTLGWRKTCECAGDDVVPCVVLDPFFGSGTTGQVAQNLGRRWIGCELNPKYFGLQEKRTAQQALTL